MVNRRDANDPDGTRPSKFESRRRFQHRQPGSGAPVRVPQLHAALPHPVALQRKLPSQNVGSGASLFSGAGLLRRVQIGGQHPPGWRSLRQQSLRGGHPRSQVHLAQCQAD